MRGRIAISTSWIVPKQQQCVRCPPVQAVLPTKEGHPHWGAPSCGCVVTGAGRWSAAGCQRPTRGGRSRSGC
jgi:hypothetical protein